MHEKWFTCLCASVAADLLYGRTSSDPKPGIHMFQWRSGNRMHTSTILSYHSAQLGHIKKKLMIVPARPAKTAPAPIYYFCNKWKITFKLLRFESRFHTMNEPSELLIEFYSKSFGDAQTLDSSPRSVFSTPEFGIGGFLILWSQRYDIKNRCHSVTGI